MDILFLTSQLPYPPQSGGTIKSWNLVKHLSASYSLGLITLLKGADASSEAKFLSKVDLAVYYSKGVDIGRSPLDLLRSYFSNRSLNLHRNFNPEVLKNVQDMCKEVNVIFVDHYEMFQYVPTAYQGKVVLHEHNAEFKTWEHFAELSWNPVKKMLLRLEADRVRKAEVDYCNRADLVLAAPNDKLALEKAGGNGDVFRTTYHLGNDDLLNEPALAFENTDNKVLYVGTLTWEPNIDGLLWFLNEVWPLIVDRNPELEFHIVGRNPDIRLVKKVQTLARVYLAGFVQHLDAYYSCSRMLVAPMRFGSGMKVKVLDALYRGIPCVTSAIGTQGLKTRSGKHVLVAHDARQFAAAVAELNQDRVLWERLAKGSRELARKEYTWKALMKDHQYQIDQLLNA